MAEVNYGLDADLKRKQDAKYDFELEKKVTVWIEQIIGTKKGDQEFGEWLKNGAVLCNLMNAIKPGTVKKVYDGAIAFKIMENITYFMKAARALGVPESSMFGTPDLYEGKNLGSVVSCIYAFGGCVQANVPEFSGPKLGVIAIESKDAKREGGLLTDQSGGYSTKQEVARPTDGNIVRGQGNQTNAGLPGAGSPRPAPKSDSPRPAAPQQATTSSPRPAAASTPSPAKPVDSGPVAGAGGYSTENKSDYGLDADLKAKQEAKYDVGLETEVVNWVEAITGEKKGDQSLHEWLKNGAVLCNLANKIKPDSVKKVNTSSLAFKQMENITFFMTAARDMGVPESSMFGTPDLYEDKNMGSVVSCLFTYGGMIQVKMPAFAGPKLGVAVNVASKDSKRASGICMDQSGGLSSKMEVKRPGAFFEGPPR